MMIGYEDYLRPMRTFLKGLPAALRHVPNSAEKLLYYGTGEAAHWAVQCNQQMLGALGVMAELDQDSALREQALAMFRYSLRTHLTGDLSCSDGKQWGKHWISVLGLERATPGLNALEPYFTDDDRKRYRNLRIFEADYRLKEYPVQACMDARKGANVPESNIWNAGFLMRTAMDYPELPQAEEYLKKATAMMLNGLSIPSDAQDRTHFYNGKCVADWHVGPNFTENFSLDHHGYMNMGYSYICLSNLALLYFNFRERNQTPPPELFHHLKELWLTVKQMTFPDGRLLRIGGDSRTRYNYCQCFAVSAWVLAAELFGDADAVRFEKGYLELAEKEQRENEDGSFYGKRLSELKDYSYFYYRRLEADPMHALSTGAWWRKKFRILDQAEGIPVKDCFWTDDFHKAALLRTGNTVRSAVYRANHGQQLLCLPLNRSDMAEWTQNLTGYLGCHYVKTEDDNPELILADNAFIYSCAGNILENAPMGEGEAQYIVARRQYAAAALPDGQTMLIYERMKILKETTFTFGYRPLHCQIPNDVYNGYTRHWETETNQFCTGNLPGRDELLQTGAERLNCDNCLSFFSLNGEKFRIRQSKRQNVLLSCGLWGMYADEICLGGTLLPVRPQQGEILYETACAVCAGMPADSMREQKGGGMTVNGAERILTFCGTDGKTYRFVYNTETEKAVLA